MSYVNTNDSYGAYNKVTTTAGVYTYSYTDLSLNSNISDQDQILVLRKFTPTAEYLAADAPDGLNNIKLKGSESWEVWTLPSLLASGSDMYTINTDDKTITMSTDPTKYIWTRTIGSTTTTHNLPIFDGSSDELYFLRKTFAVTPFVSWQSGSRFTSTQLNNEVLQLINLCQEVLDRANKFDILSPYYGSAEGICPLDSSGTVPEANLGPNAIISALSGRTINTGDGLTGGGTLATDLTLGVVIDSTSLAVTSSGFKVNFNTNDFYLDGSGYFSIQIVDNSITSGTGGIKVSIQDNLTSSDTDKALSANQGIVIQAAIDALVAGVRYLGSVTPGIRSVATLTVTDTDVLQDKTIIITTTDATVITATETDTTTTGDTDSPTFVASTGSSGSKRIAAAASIATCLNANSKLIATSDEYVVTVTQFAAGEDGETTITGTADGSGCNTTTQFSAGQDQSTFPAAPGGTYLSGDTIDIIINDGIVTDPDDTVHSLNVGDDLRKPTAGNWYVIPETVTFSLDDYLRRDGSVPMSGSLNMGTTNKITLLAEPSDAQDAATKNYVNTYAATETYVDTSTVRTIGLLADVTLTSPTDGQVLSYNGTAWINNGNIGNPQVWALAQTVAGTQNFALSPVSAATNVSTFIISIDGLVQRPTTDYTIISSSEIHFTTAPPLNSEIHVMNFGINRSAGDIDGDLSVGGDLTVTGAITGNVTSTGSTTARSLATRFAEGVNVKDYGATGDGVTDDTAAIQAALDSVSTKATILFPSGTYLISDYLQVKTDKTNLVGEGSKASVIKTTTIGSHSDFTFIYGANKTVKTCIVLSKTTTSPADDITISNLHFDITGETESTVPAIAAINSDRLVIKNCSFEVPDETIHNSFVIATYGQYQSVNSSSVSITDCLFNLGTSCAFLSQKVEDVLFSRNTIFTSNSLIHKTGIIKLDGNGGTTSQFVCTENRIQGSGILASDDTVTNEAYAGERPSIAIQVEQGITNTVVSNNVIDGYLEGIRLFWGQSGSSSSGGNVNNAVVEGNTVSNCDFMGIDLVAGTTSRNTVCSGNSILDCKGHGISAEYSSGRSGLIISSNTINNIDDANSNRTGYDGVGIEIRGTGVNVQNNTIIDTEKYGINAIQADDGLISNNIIKDAKGYSIRLHNSELTSIIGNMIYNTTTTVESDDCEIRTAPTTDDGGGIISGNLIKTTRAYGIILGGVSDSIGYDITNNKIVGATTSEVYYTSGSVPKGSEGALFYLRDLPTSDSGLATGVVWNDSGTLKIST